MITVCPGYHDDAGHYGIKTGPIPVDPSDIRAPFAVKRVYVIYDTHKDMVRGKHAHRNLIQLALCPVGSCTFDLTDGRETKTVTLDNPMKGLLIGPMVWREMRDFSPDCVLVVLASQPYDESDYIRDWVTFQSIRASSGRQSTGLRETRAAVA